MKTLFLSSTNLSSFGLTSLDVTELDERTVVIRKWNWPYSVAHEFQRHALNLLQEHPRMRILICCSHPRVLTNGRGLQKARKGEDLGLVEFNPEHFQNLPYPLHKIERGGGLTFHHPGQFIFYPIVRLNPKTLSLSKMIDNIFDEAIAVLTSWGMKDLNHENKLLGIWKKNQKIASMGIAIEKLTTFHGMAINIYRDEEMKAALMKLSPCGLTATTYSSVEEHLSLENKNIDLFANDFLRRISHAWK